MHIEHNVAVNVMTEEKTKILRGINAVHRTLRDMEADAEYLKLTPEQTTAIRVASELVMSALVNMDPDSSRRGADEHYHIALYQAIGAKY